jgi:hypothetical protein
MEWPERPGGMKKVADKPIFMLERTEQSMAWL